MTTTTHCAGCSAELTQQNRQHVNSILCKACYPRVRRCTGCKTVKPLAEFDGEKSYRCRSCTKLAARPGNKTCATCGQEVAAITYHPGSKDCPDCYGKRRKCTKCGTVYPLDSFHKTASGQGLRRICKACVADLRKDEWHSRERQCRVCGKMKRSFRSSAQVCSECYGKKIRCPGCDTVKDCEHFRRDAANPTGRQAYCKDCQSAKQSERRRLTDRKCQNCKRRKSLIEFRTATDKVCIECRTSPTLVCAECGEEKDLSHFTSRDRRSASGFSKRCAACSRKRRRADNLTMASRYSLAKSTAKRTNRAFTLSREQFAELVSQPCHYCSHPLNETGSGLDRLDPDRGYTEDNVVPCCKMCNWVKSDHLLYEEMLVVGEAIRRVKDRRLVAHQSTPASEADQVVDDARHEGCPEVESGKG